MMLKKKFNNFETREILHSIRQSFRVSQRLLKKNKPWIFLLGEKNSGKTFFLAHADIPLRSAIKKSPQHSGKTWVMDLWVAEQAVFLDLNGQYAIPEKIDSTDFYVWQYLLKRHQRFTKQADLNVILFLDVPTLMGEVSHLENLRQQFNQQLSHMTQYAPVVNITFAITQLDQLDGFQEFFSDLSAEEKQRSFGFDFQDLAQFESLEKYLEERSLALMRQINNRTLWRLHHEQSVHKRHAIKNFPFQFERLLHRVREMILHFALGYFIHPQGVYFSSSLQAGSSLRNPSKPYFVHEAMLKIISAAQLPILRKKSTQHFWKRVPLIILFVLALLLAWGWSYQKTRQAFQWVQNFNYSTTNNYPNELNWLVSLNRSLALSEGLKPFDLQYYRWVGFPQGYRLQQKLTQDYRDQLRLYFQPYLSNLLTDEIKNNLKNNFALYRALKIYLMFWDPAHYNEAEINHWFANLWKKRYPDNLGLQDQLREHFKLWMRLPDRQLARDEFLIGQARNQLQQMTISDLVFLQLRDHFPVAEVPLDQLSIANFYSPDQFQKIYQQEIPAAVEKTYLGNWVLGLAEIPKSTSTEKQALIEAVRKIFVSNYANYWRSLLDKIDFSTPVDLPKARNNVQLLSNPNSSFYQLLKLIVAQGSLDEKLYSATITDNRFLALRKFITDTAALEKMRHTFSALDQYLGQITQSGDPRKASFEAAVLRFQTKNINDPIGNAYTLTSAMTAPVNAWVQAVVKDSWHLILLNAKNYINQVWVESVYPIYKEDISGRYPVSNNSQQDIALVDFSRFFGMNGIIENFFKNYLQFFVNISGNYWTWVALNGETLPISQDVLDSFLRASLVQQMFFTKDKNYAHVDFSFSPTFLSTEANTFVFNLSGQTMILHPNEKIIQTFSWPSNDDNFASIQFFLQDGTAPTLKIAGPWALFRLLDQSTLATTNDPRIFNLTFHINNHNASVQLVTNNLVNPFIPGVINKFQLPEEF